MDLSRPPRWLLAGVLALAVVGMAFAVVVLVVAPFSDPPPVSHERGPGDRGAVYRAEQPVDVWHAGKWYRGQIHAVGTDAYFVTYENFSKSWHEWVDASRLRERR